MLWPNGTTKKPAVGGRYGDARGGRKHMGTDFVGYTTIHAITDGVVTAVKWFDSETGWGIVYDAKIGGVTVTFCHFHVRAGSAKVKRGDRVRAGQPIGGMGDTGNARGKCDHVEIRFWSNGKLTRANPETWLAARINTSPAGGDITPITGRGKNMTTLFYVAPHNNTRAKGKEGWALAGDAGDPTSPANWIETTDPAFGKALEAKHGPRVEVGPGGWNSFARDYRKGGGGAQVGNVTVDVDYQKLVDTFLNTQAARLKA